MSSPMELDEAPQQSMGPSEHDPGGREEEYLGGSGASLRKDLFSGKLPREIISEILSKVCDVDNATDVSFESTTLMPLRLSHVSRLWRDVAISTPSLWKHLQVVVRRADINSALELVNLWVPRRKRQPLKIDVFFRDERGPFIIYPEDSLNLFRVITKTATLLRKGLNYDLDRAYFESHVKAGSSGVLPFIEERYLWYCGADNVPSKEDIHKVPLMVRGVRRAVDEFGIGYHEPLTNSLTRLELQDTNGVTCLSTTELLIILAEFRQLRYLSVYLDHGDTPPEEQVIAINLLTFKLAWAYTTDPGELLDHLYAPSITEMELSGDVPGGAAWNNLFDFFERNRPPLTILALEHFDATAAVTRLADCLALCGDLESLWLENCIVDDEFVAALGRRSVMAQNSVLSRLRIFGLVSADDVTGVCLVQTLRSADSTKLKEIFVFDCNGVLEEHCEAILEQFRDTAVVETIMITPGEPFD
ncbi:hypothetical protein ACEPAH_360 [Sanghuangporus vaninii]